MNSFQQSFDFISVKSFNLVTLSLIDMILNEYNDHTSSFAIIN